MFTESYYKESLFYTTDKDKFPGLQGSIESQLRNNSAVGIAGGIYDEDGKYPISFISGFALDILNYKSEDIKDGKSCNFIDLIWENDRSFFISWINGASQMSIFRLKSKDVEPVWVKASKTESKDKNGNRYWIISTRLISDMLEYVALYDNCLFSSIIDIASKTVCVYKKPDSTRKGNLECIDYDVFLNNFISEFIITKDNNNLRNTLSLQNIVRELALMESFEYIDFVKLEDSTMYVRWKFRFLPDSRRFLLATIEDITSFYVLDAITKCLNFRGFLLKAEGFIRNNPTEKMILTFNICNFKVINNIFGYEIGNKLLKQFSDYLKSGFFNPYFVSRQDSDHFYCVIEKKDFDAEKLREFCKKELSISDMLIMVRSQCGVYEITKERKENYSIKQMCRFAKTAQQRLSSNYSDCVAIYQDSMTKEYIMNAKIINNINKAVELEEFKVYYQPIYDAKTKKIVSAEALIRWQHPQYGFLSPGMFVPILEGHGLISLLDIYVIKKINEFQKRRFVNRQNMVPISSNISRADMLNPDVLKEANKIIANSPVPNSYYRMELTESALFDIPDEINKKLMDIRDSDIRILIDDFGSGYSSFSSMVNLPFYIVKLDMNLCQMIESNEKSGKILKNMIDLCHNLNCKVVAEGIETKQQYEALVNWDCDYIQGYYFSKPVPEEEFEKMLNLI